jgi:hypothetical protein
LIDKEIVPKRLRAIVDETGYFDVVLEQRLKMPAVPGEKFLQL